MDVQRFLTLVGLPALPAAGQQFLWSGQEDGRVLSEAAIDRLSGDQISLEVWDVSGERESVFRLDLRLLNNEDMIVLIGPDDVEAQILAFADMVSQMTLEGGLLAYHGPFKATVLGHIQDQLPAAEWNRFRRLSMDRERSVNLFFCSTPDMPASELLESALSEEGLSVEEALIPAFKEKAVEIGEIKNQPVYYIEGEGIYLWGPEPAAPVHLSFWATFPAYPPHW